MPVLPEAICMWRLVHRDDQETLHSRVLAAVAIPVRIAIRNIYDRTVTEIVVTAHLDSGPLPPLLSSCMTTQAFSLLLP